MCEEAMFFIQWVPLIRHDPAGIRSLLTPIRAQRVKGACSLGCGNFSDACLARETPGACHNSQHLWTLPGPAPTWEPLEGAAGLRRALSSWKQIWRQKRWLTAPPPYHSGSTWITFDTGWVVCGWDGKYPRLLPYGTCFIVVSPLLSLWWLGGLPVAIPEAARHSPTVRL